MEFDLNEIVNQLQELIVTYGTKVIGALLTLIIGLWIIGRIVKALSRLFEKKDYDPSVESFLLSIVSIGFKILLILAVAGMFGIETTSFIAVFSALAFAVGLALQGNLSNFASGILILIFKFYKVGDFVEAAGKSGTVKEIKIFHTVLQSLDNSIIIVPNGQVTSSPIQNFTALGQRRHDLTVGIGYDDDIDKAKEAITRVAQNIPNIDEEQGVDVFVKELADSSVNFAVRFVLKNEDFWPAYKVFFERIKKELDANQISIPYPQMDVHLNQS